MPRKIPKIIHCIWIGGGQIAPVPGVPGMESAKGLKGLDGIKSWLEKTDFDIWIWWDDAHLFNGETRKEMSKGVKEDPASARSVFDKSVEPESALRNNAAPGRDIHNLRFLSREKSAEEKLRKTIELINKTQAALQPLRDLEKEEKYAGRVKLCNLRKHEFLPGQMDWMNRDLYELELQERGMFFAAASDILRYEILYNFGGVYMDVDLQLTGPLPELDVQVDGALVAIEDDKDEAQKPYDTKKPWEGRDDIEVAAHGGRCFYLMNNIVASHAGSKFIQSLRQTIRLAYDIVLLKNGKAKGELDPKGVLTVYRQKVITGSVLDLTGPNLIRENMYLLSQGMAWANIPAGNLSRLVPEVEALNRLLDPRSRKAKQAEFGQHARTAAIWRDDVEEHQGFWAWVAKHGSFPMGHVNWKTLAAKESDCRIAGMQVLKDKKLV